MSSRYRIKRRGNDYAGGGLRLRHAHQRPRRRTAAPKQEEQLLTLTQADIRAIKQIAVYYEKTLEYLVNRDKPRRFLWVNLISGMAKGFGIALGITVIAFIAFRVLRSLNILDLPIIGDFIAELMDYIENVQGIG